MSKAQFIWRIIIFILMAFLLITPWFWLGVALALGYIFYFGGFELIILAAVVDGYFGAFTSWPVFSLATIAVVFAIDFIKPYLLYNRGDEVV